MAEYQVKFAMVDAENRTVSKIFECQALDFVAALAAASGLATDLAALTGARILSYTVSQRVVYTDVADAGANRDEGITLSILKADNYKAALKVPAPIAGITDGNGNVDITHAGVAAFVSNFLTGADFYFSDGEQGAELLSGVLDK